MNIPLVILLLIILVLIIILLNRIFSKENYEVYKIKTDTVDSLQGISTSAGKIFVGSDDAERNDETQQISKINNEVTLGTNNTVFIKDGIQLSDKTLNIDYIRKIKYLPYHFDDKICIKNSCINKNHIKYMKGKLPFSINTFPQLKPFQIFSGKGFSGWKRVAGTAPLKNISINGNPMMGIKISGDLYKVTGYSEPDFQGESHDIDASSGDLTNLFPEGVKSMMPKSKKGNLLNNTCLAKFKLRKQGGDIDTLGPVPCDLADEKSKYYYFLRADQLVHSHTGGDTIHFHTHESDEELH